MANNTGVDVVDAAAQKAKLQDEVQLVVGLLTDALGVLHQSESDVSMIGEFIGLVGITGGIGVATIKASEEKYHKALAQFFAERLEAAAVVFRNIEGGKDVEDVLKIDVALPDAGSVVLD